MKSRRSPVQVGPSHGGSILQGQRLSRALRHLCVVVVAIAPIGVAPPAKLTKEPLRAIGRNTRVSLRRDFKANVNILFKLTSMKEYNTSNSPHVKNSALKPAK